MRATPARTVSPLLCNNRDISEQVHVGQPTTSHRHEPRSNGRLAGDNRHTAQHRAVLSVPIVPTRKLPNLPPVLRMRANSWVAALVAAALFGTNISTSRLNAAS